MCLQFLNLGWVKLQGQKLFLAKHLVKQGCQILCCMWMIYFLSKSVLTYKLQHFRAVCWLLERFWFQRTVCGCVSLQSTLQIFTGSYRYSQGNLIVFLLGIVKKITGNKGNTYQNYIYVSFRFQVIYRFFLVIIAGKTFSV